MKYSVIIPAYSVESYIITTLQSVVRQTFDDYEIIVVNDGSRDNTLQRVEEFAKKAERKIKVISQENGGLGAARNTGIKAAKGEYLFFVDGDDTIQENSLEEIDKVIEQNNSDIVVFDYDWVDLHGNVLAVTKGSNIDKQNFSLHEDKRVLLLPNSAVNKVFRRNLFIENNIEFPGRKLYEDVQTIPKLYYWAKNISYLPESLYNYLQRPNSIMNTKVTDRTMEITDAIDEIVRYYKEIGQYDIYKNEIEFLSVMHVLLDIGVRVTKVDRKSKNLEYFVAYVKRQFPVCRNNTYVQNMTKIDKLKMSLLLKRQFGVLSILLKIKSLADK